MSSSSYLFGHPAKTRHVSKNLGLPRQRNRLGDNRGLHRVGPAMNHPVLTSLIFTAGLALGILLMPVFPELGGVLIFLACSVILLLWVRRASR